MSGSMLKIVACALALMIMKDMPYDFGMFFGFICMLGITMVAAPGVPGEAITYTINVSNYICFFPFSRHECGTTTGGCVGTNTSTLSVFCCLSLSLFIFLLAAQEQRYASDSSMSATADI